MVTRTVALELINGAEVFTILTQPDEPSGRVVLMSHGFRSSSIGPARAFVDFERVLIESGIACLRFDQPGSGNSSGPFEQSSFVRWIDTIAALATRFLDEGVRVALLGQSMGATATVAAVARDGLRSRVPCLLLWSPDPKSAVDAPPEEFGEEGGQRYPNSFWHEAHDSDFFGGLRAYGGAVHLVYGEDDEYVGAELRDTVVDAVRGRGGTALMLPGQGHSSWAFDVARRVYAAQVAFIAQHLDS